MAKTVTCHCERDLVRYMALEKPGRGERGNDERPMHRAETAGGFHFRFCGRIARLVYVYLRVSHIFGIFH